MARRFVMVMVLGTATFAAPALHAQSLNIDLGTVEVAPSSSFGAAAGQAGTWSKLGLGTTNALPDLTGAATSVAATVTADTSTGYDNSCTGDLGHLVNDNIYAEGGTWTVTLTGLAPGEYTVYLYEPTNPAVVTGNMTVNGTPLAGITDHACALTAGQTYTTATATVTGTLTITGDSAGTPDGFAGLAGLQLVLTQAIEPIPAASPAALLLLAVLVASAGFVLLRRQLEG